MRRAALIVILAATFASCAIQEDGAPRDIPINQRGNFGDPATGDAAEGASRIYLLSPVGTDEQPRLRAVPRSDAADAEELLTSLLAGANGREDDVMPCP